ncbi:hypothetical protein [Thalassospira sp.]|uniref:hypothetical protein n=1 Tax=Thalassospira sp. TaxID=1912094 RepID=UPI000C405DE3|nr:hypothetical protein [Thalassospira sp.]MBC05707.1 hypothetical protein [Thalassospira sp.]|tara:strand:- start:1646 stop:1873 length:228 start_codon:yes stop_codon:yes gene_type:complete
MRVGKIRNLYLRRAAIVVMYSITMPIALFLLILLFVWDSVFAVRDAVVAVWRQEFIGEFTRFHRAVAGSWRGGSK